MKKICALILALCMIFMLSACSFTITIGDSGDDNSSAGSSAAESASSSGASAAESASSSGASAAESADAESAPAASDAKSAAAESASDAGSSSAAAMPVVTPTPTATPAPTATPEPTPTPAPEKDYVAEAEAQGISIPSDFAKFTDSSNTFTFYTVDYDNGINMKSAPEEGRSNVIGKVTLPFNGRLIGTCGSWYLVDNMSGQYFYIYAPIVNRIAIDANTALDDYSAIITLAAAGGTTVPDGFVIQKGICGKMINDQGTETYAIYKFHAADDTTQYGNMYIINVNNANTTDTNSWVTIYGYYNNRALVYHAGEFFWCSTTFFKAA